MVHDYFLGCDVPKFEFWLRKNLYLLSTNDVAHTWLSTVEGTCEK